MDPALQELLRKELNPDDVIEVIIRLVQKDLYPPDVKVVSQLGHIITGRVVRKNIPAVYEHASVASFKAPRIYYSDEYDHQEEEDPYFADAAGVTINSGLSGKGTVIGIIDWGCDFAHHDFVNADGTTRIIALWDQGHKKNMYSPHPFEYGKLHNRERINKALKSATPYQNLSYHPGQTDTQGKGMHGTHVMGIAAANGRSGIRGVAPGAEIIFVHLAANDSSGKYNLGDSVRILEAIDFVKKTAGNRPVSMNLSIGKHGGPHDGCTLVEMAIDEFLDENRNTAICQSTGNYFTSSAHCSGLVRPGESFPLRFNTNPGDITPNEIEIWYSGKDEFEVTISNETVALDQFSCAIDSSTDIKYNGQTVGRMYHRSDDPNNNKNHIDIFLFTTAPAGTWRIELNALRICDGRFDSWIERDGACKNCQSRFVQGNVVKTRTTNTICNGHNAIVTGACNTTTQPYTVAGFSSSGPTVDGRLKPAILAPGVNIASSKSSPPQQPYGANKTVVMSGTSMASPYVTGAAALVMEGLTTPQTVHTIRHILFTSCTPLIATGEDNYRSGYGLLDLQKLSGNIDHFNKKNITSGTPKAQTEFLQENTGNDLPLQQTSCTCKQHSKEIEPLPAGYIEVWEEDYC